MISNGKFYTMQITFSQILFCIQLWFACLITSNSFILLFSVVTFSWPHANEFLSPTFVVLCLFRAMEVVTVDDDSSTSLYYTFICLTIFFVSNLINERRQLILSISNTSIQSISRVMMMTRFDGLCCLGTTSGGWQRESRTYMVHIFDLI